MPGTFESSPCPIAAPKKCGLGRFQLLSPSVGSSRSATRVARNLQTVQPDVSQELPESSAPTCPATRKVQNLRKMRQPGQQPEEGESCHRLIEQERCLPSLADAVPVNVRDVASHGKLLAGQDGGQQPQISFHEVPSDPSVEVHQKRPGPFRSTAT